MEHRGSFSRWFLATHRRRAGQIPVSFESRDLPGASNRKCILGLADRSCGETT